MIIQCSPISWVQRAPTLKSNEQWSSSLLVVVSLYHKCVYILTKKMMTRDCVTHSYLLKLHHAISWSEMWRTNQIRKINYRWRILTWAIDLHNLVKLAASIVLTLLLSALARASRTIKLHIVTEPFRKIIRHLIVLYWCIQIYLYFHELIFPNGNDFKLWIC